MCEIVKTLQWKSAGLFVISEGKMAVLVMFFRIRDSNFFVT